MTSYHMIFKNGYSGSLNKCGGLPTHLPEVWPQIDGTDLAFLFQLYCDGEKLNIPNTLCIQGYQLFEEGDYNSDIVVGSASTECKRKYPTDRSFMPDFPGLFRWEILNLK